MSPTKTRPCLPFLYQSVPKRISRNQANPDFRSRFARFITTERKQQIKEQVKLGGKITVVGWTVVALVGLITYGIQTDLLDRQYPPPAEWTLKSKYLFRQAKSLELSENSEGMTNWTEIGQCYTKLISRMEDSTLDGNGIRPLLGSDGDIYVEGIGRAGSDLHHKSEPWRRAFHHILMGMARAAENREGWVTDKTQKIAFPAQLVLSPNNPTPQPVLGSGPSTPMDDNCEELFQSPAHYYMKILTTQGFTSRQRLDAALAYADWLDFKGLKDTAEDMYDWGIDIAIGSLPDGVSRTIDVKTGVIDPKVDYVSPNMLFAATSLAGHYARNGGFNSALPIFLSILREQQRLPSPPESQATEARPANAWANLRAMISDFITPRQYPSAPPTGDEPALRTTMSLCEEAGIMTNIGELLFAAAARESSAQGSLSEHTFNDQKSSHALSRGLEEGIAWTRQAADIAEATLMVAQREQNQQARVKCAECLKIGMQNWSIMVNQLLDYEKLVKTKQHEQKQSQWFWSRKALIDGEKWDLEARMMSERNQKVQRTLDREDDALHRSSGNFGLFGK